MQAYVGLADHVQSLQIMESYFDGRKIEIIVNVGLRFLTNRVPDWRLKKTDMNSFPDGVKMHTSE